MKQKKTFLTSKTRILLIFLLSAALIAVGGIGGTRAALSLRSQQLNSQLNTRYIGVTLQENGNAITERDYIADSDKQWHISGTGLLCEDMLEEDKTLKIGKKYKEELSVYNSGEINEYVRVILNKYWVEVDEQGTAVKRTDLDPALIELKKPANNGWITSEADIRQLSKETEVYYYSNILAPGSQTTFVIDGVLINEDVAKVVTETTETDASGAVAVTTIYEYDGKQFVIEAEVDAVQTHNAASAILSAWGRHAAFNGTQISGIE